MWGYKKTNDPSKVKNKQARDPNRLARDPHDPNNDRFRRGTRVEEQKLKNLFKPLTDHKSRAIFGVTTSASKSSIEIIFYEEIRLMVKALCKIIVNCHTALTKCNPAHFLTQCEWIQVDVQKEFDRIEYTTASL